MILNAFRENRENREEGGAFTLLPNFSQFAKLRGTLHLIGYSRRNSRKTRDTSKTNDISIPSRHPNSFFKSALYAESTPRRIRKVSFMFAAMQSPGNSEISRGSTYDICTNFLYGIRPYFPYPV